MSQLCDAEEEDQGWDDAAEGEADELCNCRFSLAYGGKILLNNATLRLIRGRRYGLCGGNGVGKSTLMKAISRGQLDGFPPADQLKTVYVEHDIQVRGGRGVLVQGTIVCAAQRRGVLGEARMQTAGMLHVVQQPPRVPRCVERLHCGAHAISQSQCVFICPPPLQASLADHKVPDYVAEDPLIKGMGVTRDQVVEALASVGFSEDLLVRREGVLWRGGAAGQLRDAVERAGSRGQVYLPPAAVTPASSTLLQRLHVMPPG